MGPHLVPSPASLAAEPITADEVAETDPAQVANTLNVYARVLHHFGLCGAVAVVAADERLAAA